MVEKNNKKFQGDFEMEKGPPGLRVRTINQPQKLTKPEGKITN